ncbi:MAG: Poly-beta-1,6-N-acetyl-D-glucosamine synthase [Anaerolineales bacterium]|nr:Poly-beta-1,6-N-acetyl-D-glucosamine synthase [Anaerolineales bacterium]
MPLITVIIPNWNGLEHLGTCLSALDCQTFDEIETIVVDNASSDESVAFIHREFPRVGIIELTENRGFAGACNAGIRASHSELVVLLNNDTEADPDWVAAIVDTFARHTEAGIVASKMLLFDRRNIFHAAGDFYSVEGIPGNRGVWKEDVGQYDAEEYVFSACGGAAAYRREMLDEIGLLDEDFYFSCEDIDLAWRAQLAGWRAVYAPAAVVYHKLSATGGGATASFYNGRNFLYLIAKDYPATLLRKHRRAVLTAQLNIAWEALLAWRGAAARARLRGMLAGMVNLPPMLTKRRLVQASRRVSDAYLESILVQGNPSES